VRSPHLAHGIKLQHSAWYDAEAKVGEVQLLCRLEA
jgi:hypothetical protein